MTFSPPRASALASGTALSASSIFRTGMTGWPSRRDSSFSVLLDMVTIREGWNSNDLAEQAGQVHEMGRDLTTVRATNPRS
jgi:hypothetical protein